jgi:hypothetical protein
MSSPLVDTTWWPKALRSDSGVIPLNSCAYTYTGNFGSAVSQGADLQFLNTPLRGLEFGGSLAYTNAHYTESVPVPGDNTQLLARNGDWLLNTPRIQGDFSMSFTWTAWSGVNAYARADTSYNLTDNSTPLFEDAGTKPGSYGAEAIRSISLRPRTLGFDVTYRY